MEVEEGIKGINDNGKNTIKIKKKLKKLCYILNGFFFCQLEISLSKGLMKAAQFDILALVILQSSLERVEKNIYFFLSFEMHNAGDRAKGGELGLS